MRARQKAAAQGRTEDVLQVDGEVCVVDESGDRAQGLGQAEHQQLCIDGLV